MATNPKVGLNRKLHEAKKNTLEEMHNDVLRGMTRYRVRRKFLDGEYTLPCTPVADMSKDGRNLERRFTAYWDDMIEEFGKEFEKDRDKLRSKFLAKYNYLYEQALLKGDVKDARAILDSMVKLTGCIQETPSTAIQINGSDDGKVVVNFGFIDDEN